MFNKMGELFQINIQCNSQRNLFKLYILNSWNFRTEDTENTVVLHLAEINIRDMLL